MRGDIWAVDAGLCIVEYSLAYSGGAEVDDCAAAVNSFWASIWRDRGEMGTDL